MKKVVDSQLKNLPLDQQQMITALLEKNPALLQKIATEMQAEMKANGNNQMAAAMKVLPKYQKELQEAMGPEMIAKLAQMQGGAGAPRFNGDGTIIR